MVLNARMKAACLKGRPTHVPPGWKEHLQVQGQGVAVGPIRAQGKEFKSYGLYWEEGKQTARHKHVSAPSPEQEDWHQPPLTGQ